MTSLRAQIKKILAPSERALLVKLKSPRAIQDYLDTLPINFELDGETYMPLRRMLRAKTAHCLEGAVLAAAAMAYHGQQPLLMDFQTAYDDEDHVIAVFKLHGYWGAISKTNHSILRYRDPIYKTPRELAMSYFHEYFLHDGRKSMRTFSAPFDLSKFPLERWLVSDDDMHWLVDALEASRHYEVVGSRKRHILRKVSRIERDVLDRPEWLKPTD